MADGSTITKSELSSVPEFFRETNFKDSKFSTLKRDTSINLFQRSLLNVNSNTFESFISQDGMRSTHIENVEASNERYKRVSEAFTSSTACRSILVPRDNFTSLMFDNETAPFAITSGNDHKIRYWNIAEPESQSYIINSPYDDEVTYLSGHIHKDIKIVIEKQIGVKSFPRYTTQRIKD